MYCTVREREREREREKERERERKRERERARKIIVMKNINMSIFMLLVGDACVKKICIPGYLQAGI